MGGVSQGAEEREHLIPQGPFTSIPGADGLPGRRFPFRAGSPAEQDLLRPSIDAVSRWAVLVVGRLVARASSHYRWCHHTRDDVAQDVLLRMLTYTLPRFDREQTAQLETFLFQAFMGDIRKCARGIARERRRCSLLPSDTLAMAAPDQRADAAIEHLAERLLAEPEIHLKPIDATTLRAWLASQRSDRAEIAAALGRGERTVANRLSALRNRISELADCELALTP